MNSQDKHITHWSATDVQKYLSGELSAPEMHQLEKAALDDPFLAEAIEGLLTRAGTPLDEDLSELQGRLAARVATKRNRVILLPWMKVAAVIVLLAGLGFTAWYTLLDRSNSKLAKSTPDVAAASSPVRSKPLTAAKPDANLASTQKSETPPTATTRTLRAVRAGTVQSASTAARTSAAQSAGTAMRTEAARSLADSGELRLKDKLADADIQPAPAARVQPAPATRIQSTPAARLAPDSPAAYNRLTFPGQANRLAYSGQVLDYNNRPLANASLVVSGASNAVATTNVLGQFKLNLLPQDTSQRLTVVLPGYRDAHLPINRLNSDDAVSNTIFLRENPNPLSEVVVTGIGRERKASLARVTSEDRTERLDSLWISVSPVTGRLAYLVYLDAAKKALLVDTTIRGTEIVSFGFDPRGTPTDFKIEHSLSPAHDAGVLRLIMEGSRWKAIHGKNVRAMVNVSFP